MKPKNPFDCDDQECKWSAWSSCNSDWQRYHEAEIARISKQHKIEIEALMDNYDDLKDEIASLRKERDYIDRQYNHTLGLRDEKIADLEQQVEDYKKKSECPYCHDFVYPNHHDCGGNDYIKRLEQQLADMKDKTKSEMGMDALVLQESLKSKCSALEQRNKELKDKIKLAIDLIKKEATRTALSILAQALITEEK